VASRAGVPDEEQLRTHSEAETVEIGARLGAELTAGAEVLLYGDLGAGKTTFVRGIAQGLDIDPAEVSSPTFVLVQEYRGRLTLYHVDLYRLEGTAVDDLGLEEFAIDRGVVVIEWAERLPRPIAGAIRVTLEDRGENLREITIDRD
jgi:tRNA threonylcarbamoyladenosine biosynthesis protein TsaE